MFEPFPYVLETHDGHAWPEWGAGPRGPLLSCDMAHRGELLDSVVGPSVTTGKPMVYHILKCELCLTIHAWPLPLTQALADYYQRTFFQQDKPDYLERVTMDEEWWQKCVYAPLLEQACRAMQWSGAAEDIRILDIGAGAGICLDVAATRGWGTYAIEPNKTLCEHLDSQGHSAYWGTLEQFTTARGREESWHIIMAQEVLEHQPCGEEWLLQCYDLLEPGGIMVIVVPNDASPIQYAACKKLGIRPYWWAVPQHLTFYTPKMLQLLVRRCGFTLVDMRGTWPIDQNLLKGYNYLGNDGIGRMVHKWRMDDELHCIKMGTWAEREAQYRANIAQRIGRELVCIARKPLEA